MGNNARILGRARDRLCVRCGQQAQGWHHRVPEGQGGPTDHFNCVPLCGHGTIGCHGWAEHHRADARAVFLIIPGRFVRGAYVGPDDLYRWRYNGEVWDLLETGWRIPRAGECTPAYEEAWT